MKKFTYYENKKKRNINVEVCESILKKAKGLMFKRSSPPLLFTFKKERNISIHSFFCKPFKAIWLNKDKEVLKKKIVTKWLPNISGKGMFLLEIPLTKR